MMKVNCEKLATSALAAMLLLMPAYALAELSVRPLLEDAQRFRTQKKYDAAATIYEKIVNEKLCTDSEKSQWGTIFHCYSASRLRLASVYVEMARYKEAIDQIKAVEAAPPTDEFCGAAQYMQGDIHERLGQPAKADKFYEAAITCKANDKEWSQVRYSPQKSFELSFFPRWEDLMLKRIMARNFLGDTAAVVELGRKLHYWSPRDEKLTTVFMEALRKEGHTAEAAMVAKYEEEINAPIIQWEKVNAPDWSDDRSRENYFKNRLAMLKSALKANTAFKLKPYEDHLIAMIRGMQAAQDNLQASREKAQKDAEKKRLDEENARRLKEEADRAEEEAKREEEEDRRKTDEIYQNMFKAVIQGGGRR